MLRQSIFLGPVFEGLVASEIIKSQINNGRHKQLYYFRDQQGVEVDFLVPLGNRKLALLEAKASRTVKPDMAAPLIRLTKSISGYRCDQFVVHLPSKNSQQEITSIAPAVKAVINTDCHRFKTIFVCRAGRGERVSRSASCRVFCSA